MASAMVPAQGAGTSSERGGGSQLDLSSSFYFLKVIAVQIELPSALYMMHDRSTFVQGNRKAYLHPRSS